MEIRVCEETQAMIRFTSACPTCAEVQESMIYTLNTHFLESQPETIHFECPIDGLWSEEGTFSLTWTPSA